MPRGVLEKILKKIARALEETNSYFSRNFEMSYVKNPKKSIGSNYRRILEAIGQVDSLASMRFKEFEAVSGGFSRINQFTGVFGDFRMVSRCSR